MADSSRVAVVTGGGRGIGRGIVLELAGRGYSLAINFHRDRHAAEQTCRDALALGAPKAVALQADVANIHDGQALVSNVLGDFGTIDVWVNNAGVAPRSRVDLLEASPESWNEVLDTNLKGPFFLSQHVAQALIQRPHRTVGQEPMIIFVTSVSSTFASVKRGEYCISKAGLSMVAKLFAARLAEYGILVYEIRPGIIETDMTSGARESYDKRIREGLTPIPRWGQPSDVGKVVAALATGMLPYSTGEVIHVDGGLQLPRL